ncbi:unnamed protein product, partial [marine sediment metagenome]
GLVRYQEQIDTFYEYFKGVQRSNPQTDLPVFRGYVVERAELSSPDAAGAPNWTTKFDSPTATGDALQKWAQATSMPREVVPQTFIDKGQPFPRLVFPLGPLVDRPWGPEVAHPPDIPLFRPEQGDFIQDPARPPEGEGDEKDPWDVLDLNRSFSGQPSTYYDGPRAAYPQPRAGYRGSSYGSSLLGDPNQPPKYLLFRFFDFSVEPGKHYQYRARLVLNNPNYRVEPRYL